MKKCPSCNKLLRRLHKARSVIEQLCKNFYGGEAHVRDSVHEAAELFMEEELAAKD